MKLVIGLGNPGEKYKRNRHNVGFMVLDTFVSQISNFQARSAKLRLFPSAKRQAPLISNEIQNLKFLFQKKFQSEILKADDFIFVRPQTMMNSSGKAVKKLVDHYKIKTPGLWVIHDDLDIALGAYKIRRGKGPKEHKGLLSIYDALKTKAFWHVRVGVDHRLPDNRIDGETYVLEDFTDKELAVIDQVIAKITLDLNSQLAE
ncbi:MAG: aminoacyl-tRNA hydrolase [Patescibacteria group bacterium]